jgi:hypothetical protein
MFLFTVYYYYYYYFACLLFPCTALIFDGWLMS